MREIRELEPHEFPQDAPILPGSKVFGMFEDGELVAILGVFTATFVDPLWIAPAKRDRPENVGIGIDLWGHVSGWLRSNGVRMTLTMIDDKHPSMGRRLHEYCGALEMVGKKLFLLPTGDN